MPKIRRLLRDSKLIRNPNRKSSRLRKKYSYVTNNSTTSNRESKGSKDSESNREDEEYTIISEEKRYKILLTR